MIRLERYPKGQDITGENYTRHEVLFGPNYHVKFVSHPSEPVMNFYLFSVHR